MALDNLVELIETKRFEEAKQAIQAEIDRAALVYKHWQSSDESTRPNAPPPSWYEGDNERHLIEALRAIIDADLRDLFSFIISRHGSGLLFYLPRSNEKPSKLLFHHILDSDKPEILEDLIFNDPLCRVQFCGNDNSQHLMKYAIKKNLVNVVNFFLKQGLGNTVFDYDERDAAQKYPRSCLEKVLEDTPVHSSEEKEEKCSTMIECFLNHRGTARYFGEAIQSSYQRYVIGYIPPDTFQHSLNVILHYYQLTPSDQWYQAINSVYFLLDRLRTNQKRDRTLQDDRSTTLDTALDHFHRMFLVQRYDNHPSLVILIESHVHFRNVCEIGTLEQVRFMLDRKLKHNKMYLLFSQNMQIVDLYFDHPPFPSDHFQEAIGFHCIQAQRSTDSSTITRHLAVIDYLVSKKPIDYSLLSAAVIDQAQISTTSSLAPSPVVNHFAQQRTKIQIKQDIESLATRFDETVEAIEGDEKSEEKEERVTNTVLKYEKQLQIIFDYAMGLDLTDLTSLLAVARRRFVSLEHTSLIGVSFKGRPLTPTRLLLAKGFIPVHLFFNNPPPGDVVDLLEDKNRPSDALSVVNIALPPVLVEVIQQYVQEIPLTESQAIFSLNDQMLLSNPRRHDLLTTMAHEKLESKECSIDDNGIVQFEFSSHDEEQEDSSNLGLADDLSDQDDDVSSSEEEEDVNAPLLRRTSPTPSPNAGCFSFMKRCCATFFCCATPLSNEEPASINLQSTTRTFSS